MSELLPQDITGITTPHYGPSDSSPFEWRSSFPIILSSDERFRQSTTFQEIAASWFNLTTTVTPRIDNPGLIQPPVQPHLDAVDAAALADVRAQLQKAVKITGVVQDWVTNLASTVNQWDRWEGDEKKLTTPIMDHEQIALVAADLAGRHDVPSVAAQQKDNAIGTRYGIAQEKLDGFLANHPIADDWTAQDHQTYARLQRHVAALGEQHISLERQELENRTEKLVTLAHAAEQADAHATWYANGAFPDRGDQQIAKAGGGSVMLTKQSFHAYKLAAMVDHAVDAKDAVEVQKAEYDEEDVKRASEGYPGYVWMLAGMPITGMVVSTGSIIDNGTKWIGNEKVRKLVRRGLKITAGGIYGLFGGAMAASCTAPNVPDTRSKTLPPPGARTDIAPNPSVTPSVRPSLTPPPPATESFGTIPSAPGILPGFGGPGASMEQKIMTDSLRAKLNKQGFAPVTVSGEGTSAVIMTNNVGDVSCVAPLRDQILSEDRVTPAKLNVDKGVATYTNTLGKEILRMPAVISITGAPEGSQCVQAIISDSNNPQFGALKLLLINSGGDVLGQISALSGSDKVTVTQTDKGSMLKVNDKDVWFTTLTGQPLARVVSISTPTPESTPDWGKFVPKTWEECASQDSESADYLMWQAYNLIGRENILAQAAVYKASIKYEKPNFRSQVNIGSPAAGFSPGYFAFTRHAIYLGTRECKLPNMSFGTANNIDVNVVVDFFAPIEDPEHPIKAIRMFTFPNSNQTRLFGVRDLLKSVISPSGQEGLGRQIGVKPAVRQILKLEEVVGMEQVSMYEKSLLPGAPSSPASSTIYIKEGKSLAEQIGMLSREKAKEMLGEPGQGGSFSDQQVDKLRLYIDSDKRINLLAELIIKQ